MNLIQKCIRKEPLRCCYVTKENIFDFLKIAIPNYNDTDYEVDIVSSPFDGSEAIWAKRKHPSKYSKVFYLNHWYIEDQYYDWDVLDNFEDYFEIIDN